jgi:hypothetical protein
MSKGWAWVSGILVTLCIIAMMLFVRSERQAYWAHHSIVVRRAQQAQEQHQPDRIILWRISR